MKKLNICFREVKHGEYKGSVDCVFLDPETFERNYRLSCYARIGQHSMGCVSYFYNSTKPAKNYESLLSEIKSIYNEFEIVVHSKLPGYELIINQLRKVA